MSWSWRVRTTYPHLRARLHSDLHSFLTLIQPWLPVFGSQPQSESVVNSRLLVISYFHPIFSPIPPLPLVKSSLLMATKYLPLSVMPVGPYHIDSLQEMQSEFFGSLTRLECRSRVQTLVLAVVLLFFAFTCLVAGSFPRYRQSPSSQNVGHHEATPSCFCC